MFLQWKCESFRTHYKFDYEKKTVQWNLVLNTINSWKNHFTMLIHENAQRLKAENPFNTYNRNNGPIWYGFTGERQ